MVKQLFTFFFLLISVATFSQSEDDNRLLNQFIVMLKPAQNINELLKGFPALQAKGVYHSQ